MFYKTTFTYTVLSDSPLEGDMSLASIAEACDTGDCVGKFDGDWNVETLTGQQAADALYEAGSEPGFFQLDDDGNPLE